MIDPIADMLSRIRNALMRHKDSVRMPYSRNKLDVLNVLKAEGYIADVQTVEAKSFNELEVTLKYVSGKPVISEINRLSTPGLRHYSAAKDIPMTRNGLGVTIVSTSKGVMTDTQARAQNVGGEVIAGVF